MLLCEEHSQSFNQWMITTILEPPQQSNWASAKWDSIVQPPLCSSEHRADGHLYGTNADALQRAADIIVELFERIGLWANPTKTKAMVCAPHPAVTRISSPAYKRRMSDRNAQTYKERKWQQVECNICNARIQARSLSWHKWIKHGLDTSLVTQQDTLHSTTPIYRRGQHVHNQHASLQWRSTMSGPGM
jgi:hypothetical protein